MAEHRSNIIWTLHAVAQELGMTPEAVAPQLRAAAEQGMTPADYIAQASASLEHR